MNLENIMLSVRSQLQKTTHCMIPFMYCKMSRRGKSIETRSTLVVAWKGEAVGRGKSNEGYRVSLWGTENVLELIVAVVEQL